MLRSFACPLFAASCFAWVLISPLTALGVADSLFCKIEFLPGTARNDVTIYIERVSSDLPLVAIYGSQVSNLTKRKISPTQFALSSDTSRFYFEYDSDRARIRVAPFNKSGSNPRPPEETRWVAGNCEAI